MEWKTTGSLAQARDLVGNEYAVQSEDDDGTPAQALRINGVLIFKMGNVPPEAMTKVADNIAAGMLAQAVVITR